MDDRSPVTSLHQVTYEAPRIESRKDVSLPLIGFTGSPPPSPSAAFREVTPYEAPRVELREAVDLPLIGLAASAESQSAAFRSEVVESYEPPSIAERRTIGTPLVAVASGLLW